MKNQARQFTSLAFVPVLSLTIMCSFTYAQSTPLSGTFGFLVNSWTDGKPGDAGQAILGVMNLDGAGNATGHLIFQLGANVNRAAQTLSGDFTGTYSLNPDNTGSVTITSPPFTFTLAMVADDGGQSLQLVTTNCFFGADGCNFFGRLTSGTGRAASPAPANGSYGILLNGSPIPAVNIGVMSFDTSGKVAFSFKSVGVGKDDTSGQAPQSAGTLSGTYTTNADGTGTVTLAASDPSLNSTYAFVTTDGGSGLLLLQTNGTPGSNVTFGTARLQ